MPRKKKSIIEVDGRQYEAKYIGKGYFSKVYQVGDRVVMYTRGDCAKEVLAMYHYDRMAHLPEIIRHENITVRPGIFWYVFSSPYYRNVTTKDKSAWLLMKKLILWWSEYKGSKSGIYNMQEFVNFVYDDFPKSIIRALQEIVDIASNCGDNIGFDFHKGNFGVNAYGTLIFRDVFWVRS